MPAKAAPRRGMWRSLLLTLPMLLWSLVMFARLFQAPAAATKIAGLLSLVFMVTLFFMMVRTNGTYRWRRTFFVALGFLFPIGFIYELIAVRGSMSIPIERMLSGDTPFCFLTIPMMIVPAALFRTIIFPGSILPTASNPHAVAAMIGLWLAATLVLGKGFCAYGCFFGGIEEGFSTVLGKARIKNINPRWRLMPWAVLGAVVLLSAALFEPVYCTWLCPFKAVTEFAQMTSAETIFQAGIFFSLFAGLVVVLPILTKRRTQCAFLCPFGAFQSLFNKLSVFEVRINREKCGAGCNVCQRDCPTMAIDKASIADGRTLLSCMRCGACVDSCPKQAAVWHIRGTEVAVEPERARLMHLYAAWAFATMFGGSIIAGALEKIVKLFI
jgi:ferredoxin-type protein NapH